MSFPAHQADCLPDPSSVFLYLQDHNIGRDHALLYEAYAAFLELKGSFTQAGLVYQEGINRWVCWTRKALSGSENIMLKPLTAHQDQSYLVH